jgi:hypothetical protein
MRIINHHTVRAHVRHLFRSILFTVSMVPRTAPRSLDAFPPLTVNPQPLTIDPQPPILDH